MNTYTAKFVYFLLIAPASFWVIVVMSGYLWPQCLFAFPGFLMLFLIFDLMVEFSRTARATADQWKKSREESMKLRVNNSEVIERLQNDYSDKIRGMEQLPGIDEDTRKASINMLVEELALKMKEV